MHSSTSPHTSWIAVTGLLCALSTACAIDADPIDFDSGTTTEASDDETGATTDASGTDGELEECLPSGEPVARLRFVLLSPTVGLARFESVNLDAQCSVPELLVETEGSMYLDVPIAGETQLVVTNSLTQEPIAEMTDVHLKEGKSYSLAFMSGDRLALVEDDHSGIGADSTRIRVFNAAPTAATVKIGYEDEDVYVAHDDLKLDAGGSQIVTLPEEPTMQLDAIYPASDNLTMNWDLATLTVGEGGLLIDAYLWIDGDCAKNSDSCEPQLLGLDPDGLTYLVPGSKPTWGP